jgi:CheY-like chemotaxis protein
MNNRLPILLADDSEDDALLVRLALKKAGISNELLVAQDGQEAVDYLERTEDALPGLLILDLKMPRVDGFEVLERLAVHPRLRNLPTVVMTSSTDKADMRRALQLGARGFYVKPQGLGALVELLQRFYLRWLRPKPVPGEIPVHLSRHAKPAPPSLERGAV